MRLDSLRDFEWYNEPLDVSFEERGMHVITRDKTDFWQAAHHKFFRDNGHFFFTRRSDNFTFVAQWHFNSTGQFDQCGVMVRIDEKNWIKAAIMYDNPDQPMLGSAATNCGYSDWAAMPIPAGVSSVAYKIRRQNGDYFIYYSFDGINFKQIRMLHLLNDQPEVKVGAYICSPQREGFDGTLSRLDFI